MPKLTIVRGVSGSGKSTWANAQFGAVVVSRDNIRESVFDAKDQSYYHRADLNVCEDIVTSIQDAAILAALKAGKDVIVDNTNIEWKFVKALAKIGYKAGAEVDVKVFDVPLATALERANMRANMGGRDVPNEVIRKQHQRFQGNKNMALEAPVAPKPYSGAPGKPEAFMVDIDGTLAHMRDYRGPFDWAKVGLDDVDEVISSIVYGLHACGYKVIVMSGRDESCRDETANWLGGRASIWFDELFMRPEKDMRADNIVKAELFDKYVRDNFDVKFVLDDRDQVVDMWRAMGLKCLQVEPGAF